MDSEIVFGAGKKKSRSKKRCPKGSRKDAKGVCRKHSAKKKSHSKRKSHTKRKSKSKGNYIKEQLKALKKKCKRGEKRVPGHLRKVEGKLKWTNPHCRKSKKSKKSKK